MYCKHVSIVRLPEAESIIDDSCCCNLKYNTYLSVLVDKYFIPDIAKIIEKYACDTVVPGDWCDICCNGVCKVCFTQIQCNYDEGENRCDRCLDFVCSECINLSQSDGYDGVRHTLEVDWFAKSRDNDCPYCD